MRIVYSSSRLRWFPEWVEAFAWRDTIHVRGPAASLGLLIHECAHVRQWRRLGTVRFLALYAWYQLRLGYQRNPLEIEARNQAQECALWSKACIHHYIKSS